MSDSFLPSPYTVNPLDMNNTNLARRVCPSAFHLWIILRVATFDTSKREKMNHDNVTIVLSWLSASYQLDSDYSKLSWLDCEEDQQSAHVEINQDLSVEFDNGVHGRVTGTLSPLHSVRSNGSYTRILLGKCHATVGPSLSVQHTQIVPAPDNCTVQCENLHIVLDRVDKVLWKTLVMISSLRFLGPVPQSRASLLNLYDDKGNEHGVIRDIVVHPGKFESEYYRWGELRAQGVTASWKDESVQQVTLKNVISLPGWFPSWKLSQIPQVALKVDGQVLLIQVPQMVQIQSSDETDGKDFTPSKFVQALPRWGFGKVTVAIESIDMTLVGFACQLKMDKIQLSLNQSNSHQWAVQLTMDSLWIGGCLRLNKMNLTGTYEADGSTMHMLAISAQDMTFFASAANQTLLQNVLNYLVDIAQDLHIPYVKVEEIPCSVRMESGLQELAVGVSDRFPRWEGNEFTTMGGLWQHCATTLKGFVDARDCRTNDLKTSATDKVATTAGLVATGASIVSPLGVAASMAALGVKDGIVHAASVGKQTRGESSDGAYRFGDVSRGISKGIVHAASVGKQSRGESADGAYRFGDVTRGLFRSFRGTKDASTSSSSSSANDKNKEASDRDLAQEKQTEEEEGYLSKNKARFFGVGGSSVGAAVGLTVLGGPIGLVAGSILGGASAKRLAKTNEQSNKGGENAAKDANEDDEALFEPAVQQSESTATGSNETSMPAEGA